MPPFESAPLTPQLEPYAKELQEFFATHRLPFGSPDDVVHFTEALSAPGTFHDEMTSMVRSVFIRQGGNIPRADLLQLVMVAVGGPQIDKFAEQYLPSVQVIVEFLGEVHRTRWGVIPSELPAVEAAGTFDPALPQDLSQPIAGGHGFPQPKAFATATDDGIPATSVPATLPPRVTSEKFFRSHMMKASAEAETAAEMPAPPLPPPVTPPAEPVSATASVAPVGAGDSIGRFTRADESEDKLLFASFMPAPRRSLKKATPIWIWLVALVLLMAAVVAVLNHKQWAEKLGIGRLTPAATLGRCFDAGYA